MRRFMTLLVTEIDFVEDTDEIAQNYEGHLATAVQEAAKGLLLRAIRNAEVVNLQVVEIKGLVSL
jgi:hypothetical protein